MDILKYKIMKVNLLTLAVAFTLLGALSSCGTGSATDPNAVKPLYVTDPVKYDTDDPAIWVNPDNPAESLVLGTDKDEDGALYVYDLKGKVLEDKVVRNLKRPNNVDVAYGLSLGGKQVDIAVLTERFTHKLRIYSLPDMKPIDNGGLEMFEGETGEEWRALMGIALYTNEAGDIYAVVGRKAGPTDGTYLWQYLLEDNGSGAVQATLARKFGEFSGKKEIEAIAVDNELGYIYYSDEQHGVRKYYADPAKGNEELALFATNGYKEDNEGISFYKTSDTTGYILVSDQSANQFKVYKREGGLTPHSHEELASIPVSTNNSDGSETVAIPLNEDFQHGLFVAMSDDKTFHYYRWEDIAGTTLEIN